MTSPVGVAVRKKSQEKPVVYSYALDECVPNFSSLSTQTGKQIHRVLVNIRNPHKVPAVTVILKRFPNIKKISTIPVV